MNFINLTLRKILQSIICVYLIINSLTAFSQSSNNSNSLNFLESILNNDDNDALNSNLDSFNNEADFENNGEIDRELLALIYEENKRENYLEKSYNDASSLNLQLQGYEFFATQMIFPRRLSVNNGGGSQDDKVLSTGDEIIIALQGPKNITYKKKVNNDGGVLIDFVGMVPVKGRKFGEVRKEIESRISETLLETKAFISLGKLKQINVIISGEVFKPGKHNLSSFSSIITALVKAGGIKKSGSLRQIKIYNNQKIYTIDLYDLLFGINPTIIKNIQLMEGAIIYVPKIGKTAAISGNIKQPGIYEILIGKTDLKEILRISGDQVTPGNSKYILQSFNSSGKSSFAGEVKKNYVVKNGDIIFLDFDYEDKSQSVQLVGEVKYPAYYSLK
ncbi:MAG: hypothetical protein CMP38_02790, partial [Rickettsiales bacterium]|nr:hypothetical protein [Rickettsiales bacterium]